MSEDFPLNTSSKGRKRKTVIGWSEYLSLPRWGVDGLRVKIDTGARTSALHVNNLVHHGGGRLEFDVVLSRKDPGRLVHVKTEALRRARVRSSNGVYCRRWFVKTLLQLGDVEKEIEISLVDREKMMFRMLLGRKALERDFLVDVSKRHLVSRGPLQTPQEQGADHGPSS